MISDTQLVVAFAWFGGGFAVGSIVVSLLYPRVMRWWRRDD